MGSRLVSKLTAQGNTVRVLTRNPSAASNKLPYPRVEYYGPSQWASAVQGTDAVINLAGTCPHVNVGHALHAVLQSFPRHTLLGFPLSYQGFFVELLDLPLCRGTDQLQVDASNQG